MNHGHRSSMAGRRRRIRPNARRVGFLLTVGLLAACSPGPRNFENENDRLRRRVLQLEKANDELTTKARRLETALAAEQGEDRPDALPDDVPLPRPAGLEIGRFSGGVDTDDDGVDDAVRLYLRPVDPRGRFVQVVGRARISVVRIPPGGEAVTVGRCEIDPGSLDAAYRSGIAGTHYTLVCPVTGDVPDHAIELTVKVGLTDLQTGANLETQQPVRFGGRPEG